MSKLYSSNKYIIDLEYRARTSGKYNEDLMIMGRLYIEEDFNKCDPIYLIWNEQNSELNYLAFTGEQVIFVNEKTYNSLCNNDINVMVLLWHELGHWYYQKEQLERGNPEVRRNEAQNRDEIVIDEIEADDYAVAHYGKTTVKNALVFAKKEFAKYYSEEKAMIREFQNRINRLI